MTDPILTTQNLTVYYGRHRGIENVDLAVEPGEVFGFLGPNGAGKTTTLRVLMDLIRPVRGIAHIFGLDCQKEGVKIRQRVGYLPGELSLYENMTASVYFDLVNRLRGGSNNRAYRDQLCSRLDLDPNRRMHEYSRGNKQKIGIVAAFMNRPELLILDEPTTGLDPLVQQAVLTMVREARAEGRTVFFSSHVLPEVQAVCDRVGIIRGGHMIAVERVSDLVRQNFRRVRVRFASPPSPEALEIDGIRLIGQHDGLFDYEIRSGLNDFLRQAVNYGVEDLETLPVTLEEVFLAYYGQRQGDENV
jgi:ABC-2 type transport system ATP-binding protein